MICGPVLGTKYLWSSRTVERPFFEAAQKRHTLWGKARYSDGARAERFSGADLWCGTSGGVLSDVQYGVMPRCRATRFRGPCRGSAASCDGDFFDPCSRAISLRDVLEKADPSFVVKHAAV